jgi:hypothetical protein
MKVNFLAITCLAAGQVAAWAPAITSLAVRTKVSPQQRSWLHVASNAKVEATFQTSEVFLDSQTQILGQPIPYSELTIGVLKETFKGENRVSQTPESVANLVKAGLTVIVQSGGT